MSGLDITSMLGMGTGALPGAAGMVGSLAFPELQSILSAAAWRGVTFDMVDSQDTVGRRVIQLLFPGVDQAQYQDMGALEGPMRVTCLIMGEDYVIRAQRLRAALMAPGRGTLVHPWWGELTCRVLGTSSITFSDRHYEVARVEATFIRDQDTPGVSDTLSAVLQKADALWDAGILTMRQLLSPLVIPLAMAEGLNTVVAQTAGMWDAVTAAQSQPVQAAVAAPLATLTAGFPVPQQNTDTTYADQVTTGIGAVPQAVASAMAPQDSPAVASSGRINNAVTATVDPATATTALLTAASQMESVTAAAANSAMSAPAVRSVGLVARMQMLVQAVGTMAAIAFASQTDALAWRDRMVAALDSLAGDATAVAATTAPMPMLADLYAAIRDLRAAVIADISSRLGRLPVVVSVPVARQMSGWALAYALAGDSPDQVQALFDDMVTRNGIIQPALTGGGNIDVLENPS
ncbi:DNA circularization N-terminal domain-containing protein [Komagataeibacter xylinus]|uniref:DNA circularization N-terminal domain-containing protein n=1 Tax=Komagataeibacter xylinus TaxID=28448 RepID=UPI00280AD818|nr:DNA circularization N-terminal domain-containing protein [Komagataeibacter xylinus]